MRPLDWTLTGGVWPMGVSTSLTWYDVGAILHVIHAAEVRLVIEIGVEHGGLAALILAYGAYTGIAYRGLDITLGALHPALRVPTIVERDAWATTTVDEVRRWMGDARGPVLLFCDGGDKPREIKLYAPLLRPGDVLLGHDYHNEYGDAAITDVPAMRVRSDWLDPTLLCMFVRGDV